MIRKATAADIDAIEASYNELFEHERRNGSLTQWIQGLYPTRATAEGGVERGEMYVYYIGDKLAASMILNSHQPAEYYDIPWVYDASDEEVMVIHTLCVPPSMSGRGLGTLMVFSIQARDYPAIMGITVVIAVVVMLGNMLVEILYGVLDPRIRHQ